MLSNCVLIVHCTRGCYGNVHWRRVVAKIMPTGYRGITSRVREAVAMEMRDTGVSIINRAHQISQARAMINGRVPGERDGGPSRGGESCAL